MKPLSRRAALGLLGVAAAFGAGCASRPLRAANADGTYCYAVGKVRRRNRTCTTDPIPPEAVEAEARRMPASPDLLTLYVFRSRWGDASNQVRLSVDGGPPAVTTPKSFVRLRLPPGTHQLVATWDEGTTLLDVAGAAGQVGLVELAGSVWAWGSWYRFDRAEAAGGNPMLGLRLVADVRR